MVFEGNPWVPSAISMFSSQVRDNQHVATSGPEDVTIDLTFDGGQTRTDLNNVYSYLKDFELLNG